MLVLSRRPNEKVVLPQLQVGIQVVGIKPGAVRLGIEAPQDVAIYREEILDTRTVPDPDAEASRRRHQVRNRLNALNVGVALLRGQLRAGRCDAAEATLAKIEQEYQSLDQQLKAWTEPPAPARPRRATRQALLVEDDTNERELLAGFLRLAGIDVATADDGAAALDHLRRERRPDVVLLGMVLPRCDGPTTVREIRRDPANDDLRILAMTGHSRDRFHIDGRVDGWFQKPLNPEELLRHLVPQPSDCT